MRRSTFLGLLAFFAGGVRLWAETEYTLHCGWSSDTVEVPMLITLLDEDRVAVKGAVVALKRVGPDGWTEAEIEREAETLTDGNGMIVVTYPARAEMTSPGHRRINIRGAVTIIAKGHRTVTVELRDHFKDGFYELSENSAPHLVLTLADGPADSPARAPGNRAE